MRHELWQAILRAYEDVDRMVAQAAGVPAAIPGQPSGEAVPGGRGALTALYERVRERLAALRAELAEAPAREHAMLALVIALDERIMHGMPEELGLSWPLLQTEWLGSADGGDAFYRIIDTVEGDPSTPSFLFEVFYFCLSQGFVGRYIGQPDAIEGYQQRLRARIVVPEATPPGPGAPVTRRAVRVRSPAWYYLGSILMVVLLTAMLVSISNCSA